jgi:MFS family permease
VTTKAIVRALAQNPGLRRVVLAFTGFSVGEWAIWIAILVYAFNRGGVGETAIVAVVQLIPAALLAPVAASLGDRYPRRRALLFTYLAQGAMMAATGIALFLDASFLVVYALAAATTVAVALGRPAHGAILPSLARTPAELTAANVATGTIQNLGFVVSPLMAGLLLEVFGAASVFAVTAVGVLASAALVAGLAEPSAAEVERRDEAAAASVVNELAGGFRVLARMPGPRTIVVLLAASAAIEGALDVFIIVLALDLLRIGESGVGILNAALGVGGVLGAVAAFSLVGRASLSRPFTLALLLAGVPLVVVGGFPNLAAALLLFVAVGAGRSLLDVAARTLLQRVTPDEALSRVLGILEGLHTSMLAFGAILVPVLIGVAGSQAAFMIAGLWLPVVSIVLWRSVRAVAATSVARPRELDLLRAVPIFAPLGPPVLERLAAGLIPIDSPAGTWIIRQGELGDRFYVLGSGEVEVFVDDQLVRVQGPGEWFGEIALLRDVPRTASVRARTPVRALALGRRLFLESVVGHAASADVADQVVRERLASSE